MKENLSCNLFEWVDEGDFEMEGSLQRKSEEVEVCIENVVLDLRKKKDKLKKKLEEERKKFQNDVGVFCIVMGINSYVLYSVCVEELPFFFNEPPQRTTKKSLSFTNQTQRTNT
ncbi:uncharacterized protein HKW66_Vig0039440 [Vigna angularis]|uniref:Uncharacterized protein n=1 Tax=Phaseolus angularis TaxID=3914 RepID=A0A8T0LC10_PHAAN|nr:uncharacterized protein HKW66_Vig0039440 [Vigna angularis]